VVYGYPAISMGIAIKSNCIVEQINLNKILLFFQNDNENFGFDSIEDLKSDLPAQYSQIGYGLEYIAQKYNIDLNGIKIVLNSSLLPGSGLGSSASTSVALIAALEHFFDLNMNKKKISNLAYEMEKIVHGTPSGIDNTTCTYGNLIYFKGGKHKILPVPDNFNFLITYTGKQHNTKKAIKRISRFKKLNPKECKQIFKRIGDIALLAGKKIVKGDLEAVGELMFENQTMLERLGISNENISEINNIAEVHGAFGSKLTGAGLGGCVIILGENKSLDEINKALDEKGYTNFRTNIDKEGVLSGTE
jgi:mevalonate kinase